MIVDMNGEVLLLISLMAVAVIAVIGFVIYICREVNEVGKKSK